MEYIAGETLAELIQRKAPLALLRKLELALDACQGLAYAHKNGHRPSRHQAGQPDGEPGRRRPQGARLRHRARRGLDAHADRHADGHAELHGARADRRQADRSTRRHLRGRPGPLRAAGLPSGVQGGNAARGAASGAPRLAEAAARARRRPRRLAHHHRRTRHREGSGEALFASSNGSAAISCASCSG